MKKIYIFLFSIILISLVSAGYPECSSGWNSENYASYPTGSCIGMNSGIIRQLLGDRLQSGDGCDCSTNKTSPVAKVELLCYNVAQRSCEQTYSDSLCAIGCAYKNCQPNWINRQEGSCQTNDKKLISYTDSNACGKNTNLPSDAGEYSCDYCQQNIFVSYSDWSICSIKDTLEKTKSYTDLNYNSCCVFTGLSSDCEINSPLYEETIEISLCDFCTPNIIQTNGTCRVNDTLISSFSDSNLCYEKTLLGSDKIIKTQTFDCDFCTPNWVEVRGPCQQDESIFVWFNDTNICFEKTRLPSDINSKPDNKTLLFECDYNNDGLIGNSSNINTSIINISLKENDKNFIFKENNRTLFHFDFDSTQSALNLANIFVERQTLNTTFSYFIIKGLDLTSQNKTKTIYMDRIINSVGICIKDDEINSISEISEFCNEDNETWLPCNGSTDNYTCEIVNNNTQYKISGLRHSGVKEQEIYCGDGIVNGDETCSSCSIDAGICVVEDIGSSSGGGGGGGGSSALKTNISATTNQSEEILKLVEDENSEEENNDIVEEQKNEGFFASITGAVIGDGARKNLFVAIGFLLVVGIAFLFFQKKSHLKKEFKLPAF